ncbi:hypothetical protein MN116_000580 [Schistosoma mekongi]|uniref:Stress protein DDR48 (DNA damage-responsive protein 48) n=1 Tax=Schistosoma mekongi TaxID=38744 RepID=A0AAE2D4M3_SCHME|nr:hypothetical protein MN116_000580 [Schistosoma mekongi]
MNFICLHIFTFITFICSNKADKYFAQNVFSDNYYENYKGLYDDDHHKGKHPQSYSEYNYDNNNNEVYDGYEQYGDAVGNKYENDGYGGNSNYDYSSYPHETYGANKRDDDSKDYHDDHSDEDHYNYFKEFGKYFSDDYSNKQPSQNNYPQKTYQYAKMPPKKNYDGVQSKPDYNNHQNGKYEQYQPQQKIYYTNPGYRPEDYSNNV